jgi:hypothetical protein
MTTEPNQPFWTTTLAAVTAFATLAGAVVGLVATAVAITDGGEATSTTPTPSGITSATPQAATPTPAFVTASPSPTPGVIELTADADSWWPSPAGIPGDDEDRDPAESETLLLDWGCSEDSRGNGSKEDCGSGLIAIRFDLRALPEGAAVEQAVLTLDVKDVSDKDITIYARTGTWSDESTEPQCEARGEVPAEPSGDESTWDVTALISEEASITESSFSLCLVLKRDASAAFTSRESDESRAPTLTLTYR